MRIVAWNSAI